MLVSSDEPVFKADNRGFRYGDGFFETLRMTKAQVRLWHLHKERMAHSIRLLNYQPPKSSLSDLLNQVEDLCRRNHCEENARVRISFFNGNGNVFDNNTSTGYIIEASALQHEKRPGEKDGLTVGAYKDVRKSCDSFSNLKSANYLFSRLGIEYAKKSNWNDCLIFNQHDRICETTIANLFWIKDKNIYTPPLSEGCVRGVMRANILSQTAVVEKACMLQELLNADEIFLTNATSGIRWVSKLEDRLYENKIASLLYDEIVTPLFGR